MGRHPEFATVDQLQNPFGFLIGVDCAIHNQPGKMAEKQKNTG